MCGSHIFILLVRDNYNLTCLDGQAFTTILPLVVFFVGYAYYTVVRVVLQCSALMVQGDVKVANQQECRGRPPEAFARGDIQTTNELRSGFAQVV